MNIEDDEDPEYGDTNNYVKYNPSDRDKMVRKYWENSRKYVESVSRQFNSHMIELYNGKTLTRTD